MKPADFGALCELEDLDPSTTSREAYVASAARRLLFDGVEWDEARCAVAVALCAVLRSAPEVSGEVRGADGEVTPPQGQVMS